MKIIKIKNTVKDDMVTTITIPTVNVEATIVVNDNHSGADTIMATGIWISSTGKISLDIGDRIHCLNEVSCDDDDVLQLSTFSNGFTYMVTPEVDLWSSNYPVARIVFDDSREMKEFLGVPALRLFRKIKEMVASF